MEIAIGVKAVKDEGMASVIGITAIHHRTHTADLINQKLVPVVGIKIVTVKPITLAGVVKITLQGR